MFTSVKNNNTDLCLGRSGGFFFPIYRDIFFYNLLFNPNLPPVFICIILLYRLLTLYCGWLCLGKHDV